MARLNSIIDMAIKFNNSHPFCKRGAIVEKIQFKNFEYNSYEVSAHFSVILCKIFALQNLKNRRI